MVGKLLGGGLVLLGTALWCRGEIQARRRETDRAAELAAALGEMVAEIRSLRRPMPRLLERQGRPAPAFVMDPEVTDFYRFTRDSFRLEGYDPLPFDEKIPVAI